jgi:hypothetical protein
MLAKHVVVVPVAFAASFLAAARRIPLLSAMIR